MSKKSRKKGSKQTELTRQQLLRVAFPVNPFLWQEIKKEQVTTDISGLRCFELSKSLPRGGLLEKMSKVLLTSKTAWSSRLCALTWKERDTKSGRSIFQLAASALPTEEKECGLWLTPSASMRSNRSEEAMKHREKYRKSIGRNTVPPGNLAEQVQYGKATTDMKQPKVMWPTPRACDLEGGVVKNVELKKMSFSRVNKKGVRFGVKLKDAVHKVEKMWPTPRASAAMAEDVSNIKKRGVDKARLEERVAIWPTPTSRMYKLPRLPETMEKTKRNPLTNTIEDAVQHREGKSWKETGSLNPTWVEWLMGYPAGYTDLKHWEILSSRKSRKKSVKQSTKQQ